jgi:hypothetical protein
MSRIFLIQHDTKGFDPDFTLGVIQNAMRFGNVGKAVYPDNKWIYIPVFNLKPERLADDG